MDSPFPIGLLLGAAPSLNLHARRQLFGMAPVEFILGPKRLRRRARNRHGRSDTRLRVIGRVRHDAFYRNAIQQELVLFPCASVGTGVHACIEREFHFCFCWIVACPGARPQPRDPWHILRAIVGHFPRPLVLGPRAGFRDPSGKFARGVDNERQWWYNRYNLNT
jgi:hypothetical protein